MTNEIDMFLEQAINKFGELPVIRVNESLVDYDEDEDMYVTRLSREYLIDLAKLNSYKVFEFNYVIDILEDALNGVTNTERSFKYSFSDTPEWWDDCTADSVEGRKLLEIDVKLYD